MVANHGYSSEDWHRILGHCNINDVNKLVGVTDGMKINTYEG